MRFVRRRWAPVAALVAATSTAVAAPYEDDPEIVAALDALPAGGSLLLPKLRVECGGDERFGFARFGPGQRDYCNKMPYAPERETALYAGGNHMVPHRMNDVWEFHLGSNTWHLLHAPDGGNAGAHKAAYFLTSRTLVRDPDAELDEKQRGQIAAYREWWGEHVEFEDGHLQTKTGGPIMPAHTWDGFTYDAAAKKMLWGMGASPAGQLSTHARFTGKPVEHWETKADPGYTPMWTFDPQAKRWEHYRTAKSRAALRGMGASMTYLPDSKRTLWYVAAQNVSPHAFEMWSYDAVADEWNELKPNGGKSISELSKNEGVAPGSELQAAYSPKHRKLVAVLENDTFVYDVQNDRWSKVATDGRIFGHDAKSVFGYDPGSDQFLLAFPPGGKGKDLKLAVFSLADEKWRIVEPGGAGAIPPTKYGSYAGYFDPKHGVFVVQGRYVDRVWVYRPRRG